MTLVKGGETVSAAAQPRVLDAARAAGARIEPVKLPSGVSSRDYFKVGREGEWLFASDRDELLAVLAVSNPRKNEVDVWLDPEVKFEPPADPVKLATVAVRAKPSFTVPMVSDEKAFSLELPPKFIATAVLSNNPAEGRSAIWASAVRGEAWWWCYYRPRQNRLTCSSISWPKK